MIKEIYATDINGQVVTTLAQWDSNVCIYVKDPIITSAWPVHFLNADSNEAIVKKSTMSGGALKVTIPNTLLHETKPIIAFIYVSTDGGNRSMFRMHFNIVPRPMPSDVVYKDSDDYISISSLEAELKSAIQETKSSLEAELKAHASNKNNPHGVTAEQVGARPNTWMPTAEEVGARPDSWIPTAAQVGARPNTWMPTAEEVGAASSGDVATNVYFCAGRIMNDGEGKGISGWGTATVTVVNNRLAIIDFAVTVGENSVTSTYNYGINRDLLRTLNSSIPVITPVRGGRLTYMSGGTVDDYLTGYGGFMAASSVFWSPARVYANSGAAGGWAPDKLSGKKLVGTCYGTVGG